MQSLLNPDAVRSAGTSTARVIRQEVAGASPNLGAGCKGANRRQPGISTQPSGASAPVARLAGKAWPLRKTFIISRISPLGEGHTGHPLVSVCLDDAFRKVGDVDHTTVRQGVAKIEDVDHLTNIAGPRVSAQ